MMSAISIALIGALGLLLLAAGIQDARTREIGNAKNAAIALLAPAWWWAMGLSLWPDMATQVGLALVVLVAFGAAFQFGWMGGGDVKLLAALALWLPAGGLMGMLVAMSLIGGALTVVMLIEHAVARRDDVVEVPYGVAIVAAALLALPHTQP